MQLREFIDNWAQGKRGQTKYLISELASHWVSEAWPNLSDWEKEELAEKQTKRIRNLLGSIDQEFQEKNIPTPFTFDSSLDYASTIFRYDDPFWKPPKWAKELFNRTNRINHVELILKTLSLLDAKNSLAFELFSAELLNLLGYQVDVPNQRTKDGGVDIFGFYDGADNKTMGSLKFRILGQAKRWTQKIERAEVELFYQQVEDFKHQTGSAFRLLPEKFKTSNLPVYGIFCTNSFFTREARFALDKNSIKSWDGQQLAWGIVLYFDKWFDENGKFLAEQFAAYYQARAQSFHAEL